MKKLAFKFLVYSFVVLSVTSFVFLNIDNPDFTLFNVSTDINKFDVPSSTLPDVEAVKNTILIFKEMWNL